MGKDSGNGILAGDGAGRVFPSRLAAVEAGVIFVLLLPFYGYLLRRPGPLQVGGFLLVGLIIGYIVWLSPHRNLEPRARSSLLEAFGMLTWSMLVIWGVLPWGPVGKMVGQALIGWTVIYILFFARIANGDSFEDWGLGSPFDYLTYLRRGEHRARARWALLALNLAVIAICWFAGEVVHQILATMLRKSFGVRDPFHLSFPLLVAAVLPPINLFMAFFRYDNLREAGRLLGWYFLIGVCTVSISGYLYIFKMHDGWVEFDPMRGLVGVGGYVLWGTLQELLFLSYFNTRIRKGLISPILSALLTAVVFSLYHLAAYELMFICFLIMIVWALIFQRAPNLFLMGLVHGISGGFGSAVVVKGMPMFKIKGAVGPFNL